MGLVKTKKTDTLNTELGLGVDRWQMMMKSHDRANLERIVECTSKLPSLVGEL